MMTQAQIKQSFNDYIEQQNPQVNPNIAGTDWDVYGSAIGGVGASVYQDIESLRQAIFVQFSSGVFLDYSAFSLGLPPRQGASFALVTAENGSPFPSSPYVFPAGTIFTSTFNSNPYVLINDVTASTSAAVVFSLQSQQSGNGYQLPVGSTLTNTIHPTVTITVGSSTDGQAAESDGQLRKRILNARQNPTGAGRASDYVNWSIIGGGTSETNPVEQGPNNVQGALVIPSFFTNNVIGVFTLSGTFNYDYVLLHYPSNTNPYTLTTPPAILSNVQAYINIQKPVQANPFIQSVSTYMISNAITINVVLPIGVTLSTNVTNFDGSTISVENIIFQEFRRGIISYQLGGTVLDAAAYLMLSQLEQVVDVGLSINGGIYAQILVSREILVDGITQNITVPYNTLDGNDNLEAVYDILQSNVTINQIT